MKRYIFLFLLTAAFSTVFAKAPPSESLDGIAAVVNDSVITQSELDEGLANIRRQFSNNQNALPQGVALRKQVLDQLINRKLQLELAERAGIRVTPADVEKAIKGVADQNKVTTAELFEKIKEEGMDPNNYRKEIREEILMQQVQQQQVASKIKVSQQEVKDFLRSAAWKTYRSKEYHLEDILIPLPEVPSTEDVVNAKQQADEVLAKLNQGMSFQQAAMTNSGNAEALQGGDLGWRKLPEVPQMFSQQLVNMKVNDIMGPVLTPNGYHIVKLAGIRNSLNGNNAEQEKQLQQLIFQRKFEESLQSWIMKLRSESYINTHPEKSV